MRKGKVRGEFDDYKYPFLNNSNSDENPQEIKAKKEAALAEAIKFAEELKKKYGASDNASKHR